MRVHISELNLFFGLYFNKHDGLVHVDFLKVEIASTNTTASLIVSFGNPLIDEDIILILKGYFILPLKLLEKLFSLQFWLFHT